LSKGVAVFTYLCTADPGPRQAHRRRTRSRRVLQGDKRTPPCYGGNVRVVCQGASVELIVAVMVDTVLVAVLGTLVAKPSLRAPSVVHLQRTTSLRTATGPWPSPTTAVPSCSRGPAATPESSPHRRL
jgi:hypothetical protein